MYYLRRRDDAPEPVYWVDQANPTASGVVQANGANVEASPALSLAVYDDGVASPTLFWGTRTGNVYGPKTAGPLRLS